MTLSPRLAFAIFIGLLWTTAATAGAGPDDQTILVTARRSGVPTWTIPTPRGTLILVGEIRAVPKSTPWQPEQLKEAAAGASRIILRAAPKVSPGDILRLIFRGGRFVRLPDGTVAADYLDAGQRARLARLETRYNVDYDRRSFLMSAFDLLARRLDFDDETTDDATEIVRKAAGRARVPIRRPERLRGEDLLDNLAAADPAGQVACLEAAMTAAEAGPAIISARGDDWRRFDVPAVMANPLEQALRSCWPWADADVGGEIRDQWTRMVAGAVADPGVTLAVVPLNVLAEPGGTLDRLRAQGFAISGPAWR